MLNINKLKSSELKSAIYAMILGDGSLYLAGKRSINYRLNIGHSTRQEEYLFWKKKIVDQIGSVETKVYRYKVNKKYDSVRISTNSRKYFTKIANKIYHNKVKKLDKKILKKINDFGLAIWYMDDGSTQFRGSHVRCTLHTQNFTEDENKLIVEWFRKKYKIESKVQVEYKSKTNKIYYRIEFNKKNSLILLNIIKPYIKNINCMKYKIEKKV